MRSEFAHRVLSKGETARTLILRKNLGKLACNNSCRSVGQHIAKVITGVPQDGYIAPPIPLFLSQHKNINITCNNKTEIAKAIICYQNV